MNEHVSEPFRTALNQFAHLSAERPEDKLAQMTPEEQAEYNAYLDAQRTQQEQEEQLVRDNPAVESALRQAMKDFYGQPYLFDYQLIMTVREARAAIHAMQHHND